MTSVAEVDSAMVNSYHLGSVLDKRTEFRFRPNHPFGREVGLCQVLGKCWVALS